MSRLDTDHRVTIHALTWESDFFAQRIGKVDLGQLEHLTPHCCQPWDLVQAKVNSGDYLALDTLSKLGFQLAEGEAEFSLPISETERQAGIRIARPSQIEALRCLAASAFTESRFREPWFTPVLTQNFYAQWIENAVLGIFDHQCLLAVDDQNAITGMVSLREVEGGARIGLLAVTHAQRGTGIGRRLLLAAADWARVRGLTQLFVATQLSNLAAMRLYSRQGASLENTSYWLYRKSDDPI